MVASSYMAGVVILNCIAGLLSDLKFGRRRTLLVLIILHVIFSFLTAFATSYEMFIGMRLFVGGTIHAAWSSVFAIAIETTHEPKRIFTGGILNIGIYLFIKSLTFYLFPWFILGLLGWNIGSIGMTLIAYLLRSWRNIQLTFASIAITLILYFFYIPESPRWYLETNKIREARHELECIAKINGKDLTVTSFGLKFDELKRRYQTRCNSTSKQRLESANISQNHTKRFS